MRTKPNSEFIREAGFPFVGDLIHSFIGGSELHGAKREGKDDHDIYGLYLEPADHIVGLQSYEHFTWSTATNDRRNGPDDVDITLYGLRKWAGMAVKGNPTALHFLFAPNQQTGSCLWETYLPTFKKILLARSCAKQFKGFVDAQMGRLLGTRGRGRKGQRPELEEQFGYDVKAAMHAVRLLHECAELLSCGTITLPRPEKNMLIAIRSGQWSLDAVSSFVNELFVQIKALEQTSQLPPEPDRNDLSKFITEIYLQHWTS